jgi:hypothetical protein
VVGGREAHVVDERVNAQPAEQHLRCAFNMHRLDAKQQPRALLTSLTVFLTASSSRMSHTCVLQRSAPSAAASSSRRTLSSLRSLRPTIATQAPSATSSCAVQRPMPEPPPVTMITEPAKRPGAKIEAKVEGINGLADVALAKVAFSPLPRACSIDSDAVVTWRSRGELAVGVLQKQCYRSSCGPLQRCTRCVLLANKNPMQKQQKTKPPRCLERG